MTRLVAATGNGLALLTAEDDGFRAALTEIPGAQCVASDPRGDAVYGGSRGAGVWRSPDGGETWERLPFPQADVFSLAVSPADGTVYAGCEPSMLFRSRDAGESWEELDALRALPSAPTWSFPPRPWTSHVRWIAPSPHDSARLLAGIELGGLMVSEDAGETWLDHRPGAERDVHSLAWHPRKTGRAYEAAGGGAAWSSDGGLQWRAAEGGRERRYTWALAVDPDDPGCWWVSASPGPLQAHRVGHADAFVYRWRGDGPWEALGGGLPQPLDAMPYALLHAGGRLLAGLADGRLYGSEDGGDTWTAIAVAGERLEAVVALVALEGHE